eukprot:snap_masked-scaffold_40-processed-gene-2.34-mRNA-1 protein AED:1.00 eAED:1.00 QI:0/0/0/0/1/1/2/0/105
MKYYFAVIFPLVFLMFFDIFTTALIKREYKFLIWFQTEKLVQLRGKLDLAGYEGLRKPGVKKLVLLEKIALIWFEKLGSRPRQGDYWITSKLAIFLFGGIYSYKS